MENKLNNFFSWKNGLIAILILIILFLKNCERTSIIKTVKGNSDTIKVIETKIDTFRDSIPYYVPYPVKSIKIDTHHHYLNDMSICQYMNFYSDTISDSNLTFIIQDSIQGWLRARKVNYEVYKKTTTITQTIKQMPKYSVYLGAEAGGNKAQFQFSPFITIRRDGTIVSLKHDIINKTTSIGLGIKILQK